MEKVLLEWSPQGMCVVAIGRATTMLRSLDSDTDEIGKPPISSFCDAKGNNKTFPSGLCVDSDSMCI